MSFGVYRHEKEIDVFDIYPRHGHRLPQQIAEDAGGAFEPMRATRRPENAAPENKPANKSAKKPSKKQPDDAAVIPSKRDPDRR